MRRVDAQSHGTIARQKIFSFFRFWVEARMLAGLPKAVVTRLLFCGVNNEFKKDYKKSRKSSVSIGIFSFAFSSCRLDLIKYNHTLAKNTREGRGIFSARSSKDNKMIKKRNYFRKRGFFGQSTIEYALLVAIVAAAFLAMRTYVVRAMQANLKLIENQINTQ